MELWQYDATDLARLIRTGRASARRPSTRSSSRLHKVNPAINAVVRVLEPEARAAAETADAARARGHALPPLHGVPVTTKINVDQTGLPTDNGVVPLKDFIAKEDSPVVANLKHAGAIIIGRTNAPAFSMRIFTDNALHGRTLNPRDPDGDAGRLERRRGRGDGHRHRLHRAWQRHRRLGPHPRLLQRRGRPAHRLRAASPPTTRRQPMPAGRSAPC